MVKTRIFISLALLVTISSSPINTFSSNSILGASNASDQSISDDSFVSVDNFLNSGKGFSMEFTFEAPSSDVYDEICFMTNNWKRLTNYFKMYFNKNGSVTTNYGEVFKLNDKYYFQLMFEDLAPLINTQEGATGNETVDFMYIKEANVRFENITTTLIESQINVSSKVEVRDGTNNGLRFKSHIPSIKSGYTYGHIIVPSYYVAKYNSDYLIHLNEDGHSYLDIPAIPVSLSSDDDLYKIYGEGYSISSTIINIKPENYFLDFVAIPYEKSSNGIYLYGNGSKLSKTNLYKECARVKQANNYLSYTSYGKAFIDSVINKCEVHPNPIIELGNSKVFSAYNSEQIVKNYYPTSPTTLVKIQAGRNEREGAQIILNSSLNGNEYYVNFEPFVNENKSSRISAENIKVYKELYQNVESNWTEYYNVQNDTYINGAEDPSAFGYYPDGLLPFEVAIDACENKLDNVGGNNNGIYFTIDVPSDISAGKYTSNAIIDIKGEGTIIMPIELTVYDFTLPSQNYAETVCIVNTQQTEYLYGDQFYTGLSSKVHKAAYELLADRHISGGQLPADKWAKSDLPKYIETVKKYTQDERVSVFLMPDCYQLMDVTLKYKYTKNIVSTKTKEINLVNMPIYVGKDYLYSDGKTELYGLETLFTELVKASTPTLNLLKKGVFYFPQADEPGNNEEDQVQNVLCQSVLLKAAENVLKNEDLFTNKPEVKKSLENVRYVVTSHPRGLLRGKVVDSSKEYTATLNSITPVSSNCDLAYLSSDISTSIYKDSSGDPLIHMRGYCPQFDCFQVVKSGDNPYSYKEIMNMLDDDEYNMWWYGCCMPVAPFPVHFLNVPMMRYRVNKWLQYYLGVQGELYYMCNRTCKVINDEDGEVQYPCSEEQVLAGQHTYNGAYGDGVLIYPCYNKYKDIADNLYWISSLKLENWSEGCDDYNYLHYADELIKELPSSEQNEKLDQINQCISNLTQGKFGTYYYTKDSSNLYNQKEILAKIIESIE